MPKPEKSATAAGPSRGPSRVEITLPTSVSISIVAFAKTSGISERTLRKWVAEKAERAACAAVEGKVREVVRERMEPLFVEPDAVKH